MNPARFDWLVGLLQSSEGIEVQSLKVFLFLQFFAYLLGMGDWIPSGGWKASATTSHLPLSPSPSPKGVFHLPLSVINWMQATRSAEYLMTNGIVGHLNRTRKIQGWITSKGEQRSKTAKRINVMTNAAMEELCSSDDNNSSSSGRERYTEFMGDSCCARYCLGPNPSIARFIYALIFLVTCLLAWTIRDYGRNALSELQRTKKLEDSRNFWHSEWWPAKIIIWIGFMVVPFFLPSAFIQLYGKFAHFGAGAFLMIQLISVISFITWLNDCCQSDRYARRWLNILFITLTLVLLQLMTLASMHSKVKAGFLAPGLMGMYIVYLCWSAIRSEPLTEICNKKAAVATSADWLIIVSFVIAVLAIVIATFSTGIDSKCLQFRKTEADSDDDVPYGYGFFHFVFAMGAMYFAMLFVGWNAHNTMQKWTIDVGWVSTWVRIVNEWVAILVYIWMLVAPLVWKSRTQADSV
ncbi:Serine incorporator (Serinc) [Musa troglodytarum]|uniref:Serine incorporator (Serinc) n=1 Tax=Musa troglodytarum TaxID=320322 RepID=A0A9E7I729_9LILI|nr:Serine incorporator (Serinc) [Musa troglodytarum]